MQRVLDIDLDFFLADCCPLAELGQRPNLTEHEPWTGGALKGGSEGGEQRVSLLQLRFRQDSFDRQQVHSERANGRFVRQGAYK